MDFKVPDGYDDFVTSAEDLLKEFKSGDSSDYVSYRIYFNRQQNSKPLVVGMSELQQALDCLEQINNFVQKELGWSVLPH